MFFEVVFISKFGKTSIDFGCVLELELSFIISRLAKVVLYWLRLMASLFEVIIVELVPHEANKRENSSKDNNFFKTNIFSNILKYHNYKSAFTINFATFSLAPIPPSFDSNVS